MKIDVKHVAKLANLPLKDDEVEKFEEQLSDIVSYIDTLNKLNTENVEPTAQVTGLVNVARDDSETHESLTQEEALSNAQHKHDGMFVVDQLVEEK